MNPTAFISTRWDTASKSNVPTLVVIITDEQFLATGERGTQMEKYASSLAKDFLDVDKEEWPDLASELTESFTRAKHGHGYGGTTEVVTYVGSDKIRVDKIREQLSGQSKSRQ